MKFEPNTTPAEVAQAIIAANPGCALDFALQVTRFVSKQLTRDAVASSEANPAPEPMPANVTTVIATVCELFGVTEAELLGKGKARRVARPRHMFWMLLRTELAMSFSGIATRFGNTRATVRDGCSTVDTSTAEWDALRQCVAAALRPVGLVEAAE